ncbi:MAG: polysaccharide deacetylase family protein [Actinobacteria bacterium]|nr:polysaccharide deacetylase family protein [Actinomycetota bacterium]
MVRDRFQAPHSLRTFLVPAVLAMVLGAAFLSYACAYSAGVTTMSGLSGSLSGGYPAASPGREIDVADLPASLPPSATTLTVPILMYHYVDETPPPAGEYAVGLTVETEQFSAEMDYLASHGYHAVTLEQIYAAVAGRKPLPRKPVAITFDDGGLDNYMVAFPILRAHQFVATFFVITGFVGRPICMNWQQLKQMYEAGMAIESHTVHHLGLTGLGSTRLKGELVQSRESIERELGRAPLVLAYPASNYNESVIRAARAAGYLMGVTAGPGRSLSPESPFTWPRLRVSRGLSLKAFARLVGGEVPSTGAASP